MSKNLFKGYDHRNNITENADIMKVTINYEKLALLKILNNPNMNIYNKINILNDNSYLFHNNSSISSSILKGGLLSDWDFIF
jgi:hypothetical protein